MGGVCPPGARAVHATFAQPQLAELGRRAGVVVCALVLAVNDAVAGEGDARRVALGKRPGPLLLRSVAAGQRPYPLMHARVRLLRADGALVLLGVVEHLADAARLVAAKEERVALERELRRERACRAVLVQHRRRLDVEPRLPIVRDETYRVSGKFGFEQGFGEGLGRARVGLE